MTALLALACVHDSLMVPLILIVFNAISNILYCLRYSHSRYYFW